MKYSLFWKKVYMLYGESQVEYEKLAEKFQEYKYESEEYEMWLLQEGMGEFYATRNSQQKLKYPNDYNRLTQYAYKVRPEIMELA